MRTFRTCVIAASAFAALSWTTLSSAEEPSGSTRATSGQQGNTTGNSTTKTTADASKDKSSGSPTTGGSTSGTSGSSSTDTSGSSSTSGTSGSGMGGSSTQQPSTGQPSTGTSGTGTTGTAPYGTGTSSDVYGTGTYGHTQTGTTTTTQATMQPQPLTTPGAEMQEQKIRPNRPMLVTGGIIFAGTYGASAIVAAASDTHGDEKLYIPVVGPWLDLSERQCNFQCGTRESVNNVLIIGSGVAQGVGVGLALASLFIPETKEVTTVAANKPKVRVAPVSYAKGGGIGAVGTF